MKLIHCILAMICPLLIMCQPVTISGKVVTEDGFPVAGATVTIKGSDETTLTNFNGLFVIRSQHNGGSLLNDTILVSALGFETAETPGNASVELTIILKRKTTAMQEVLLYSGYQELAPGKTTGSFFRPSKEVFDSRVSRDVISRLQGITSGLVFNTTAQGNTKISIRGRSTIFANDEPLIVVDNFPYEGDINAINPADVESITVLKDAAAASVWGVRAGNGVIVVTTRKGKFNQPLRVQFNTNITIGQKPDLFYDPRAMSSSDFIDVEKMLFASGYYSADEASPAKPPLSPVVEILIKKRDNLISAGDADAQINALRSFDVRNDLAEHFYRRPLSQQYSINVNGGSNKATYFFSAGYDKNSAMSTGDESDRITFNSVNTFIPFKKMELLAGITFVQSSFQNDNVFAHLSTGGPNNRNIYPYAQFEDGQYNPLAITKDYRLSFAQSALSKGLLDWQFIPMEEIGRSMNNSKTSDTRIQAGIKYSFFKGLDAELKYQYQQSQSGTRGLSDEQSWLVRNQVNRYSTVSTAGQVTARNFPLGDMLSLSASNMAAHNFRGQVNYNYTLSKHNVIAIAGMEARDVETNSNKKILYGYSDDLATFQDVNYTTTFTLYPSGTGKIGSGTGISATVNRFRSWFANAAYTYNDRYIFSAGGRIDQSNFFGVKANQRSVPLWSAGLAWILNKEKFYHLASLPSLKLRVTYGFNGNLDKSISAYTTARYSSGSSLTGLPYATIVNPPNPALRWEKTAICNIGVDFATKNDFLSGSLEYFFKKGTDLMGDGVLAPSSGLSQVRGNFADMKGHGLDLVLNANIIRKPFHWTTTFLFSYATDEVTRFDVRQAPSQYTAADGAALIIFPYVGKPVYSLFSLRWAGLDPLTGDPMGYVADTTSKNYALLNAPSAINDLVYHGPARPVFSGGLTNTISWKGFSLLINISYKMGYYFRRQALAYNQLFFSWAGHKEFAQRWQKPGDEKNTNVPSLLPVANISRDNFYYNSMVTVEKGDHIRLQDISFSYRIERSKRPKLPLDFIQLYVYANNLGILWRANKLGMDPDYPRGGIPAPRSFTVGIRAGF